MSIIAVVRREKNVYLFYTPELDSHRFYSFREGEQNAYTKLDHSTIMFASYDEKTQTSQPLLSFELRRAEDKQLVQLSNLDVDELLDIIDGFYDANVLQLQSLASPPTIH